MRPAAARVREGPDPPRRKNPQPAVARRERRAALGSEEPGLRPEHVQRPERVWPRTPQIPERARAEDRPAHRFPRGPGPHRWRASARHPPCGPSSNPLWASGSGTDWELAWARPRNQRLSGSSVRTGQTAPGPGTRPRKQGPIRIPMRERSRCPAHRRASLGGGMNQKVGYSYKSASSDAWR